MERNYQVIIRKVFVSSDWEGNRWTRVVQTITERILGHLDIGVTNHNGGSIVVTKRVTTMEHLCVHPFVPTTKGWTLGHWVTAGYGGGKFACWLCSVQCINKQRNTENVTGKAQEGPVPPTSDPYPAGAPSPTTLQRGPGPVPSPSTTCWKSSCSVGERNAWNAGSRSPTAAFWNVPTTAGRGPVTAVPRQWLEQRHPRPRGKTGQPPRERNRNASR